MIRQGEFDRILVRPQNEILQILGSKMELTRLSRILQAVIMFGYGIAKSRIHWSLAKIITIVLMILGRIALFTGLFLIYAALSFFALEGLEFMNILTDGAREFCKYPMGLYGKILLFITTFFIPYAVEQYYPLHFLLDKRPACLYMYLPLMAFLFLIPCYFLWRYGVHHYQSSGS